MTKRPKEHYETFRTSCIAGTNTIIPWRELSREDQEIFKDGWWFFRLVWAKINGKW